MAYYILITDLNLSSLHGRFSYTRSSPCMRSQNVIIRVCLVSKKKHMNKAAIVEAVHGVLNTTKVQAEQVVDKVFDSIVAGLKKGDEVSIAGLGIFSVKTRKARQARNPRTGEAISVPAMKVPKFRAAKALKDAVK